MLWHENIPDVPECSAHAQKMLDTMYANATDPDIYFLHRMYNAVLLAGACIAGQILGAPKAREYWLTAEKELDVPLQLDWKALTNGSQHERALNAMKQLAAAAQDTELDYRTRVTHADVLEGMTVLASAAGMPEAAGYDRLAGELHRKIRPES